MYTNTSNAFATSIHENERHFYARLMYLSNGTYVEQTANIRDLLYKGGTNGSDHITFGSTVSATVDIKLYKPDFVIAGREFKVDIGLDINGSPEWVPMGLFTAQKPEGDWEDTSLVAYDRMIKFEKTYIPAINFPASTTAVISDICTEFGVPYRVPQLNGVEYSATMSKKPSGYTARDVLSQIGCLLGMFAVIDREGYLCFKWYKDFDYPIITEERYWDALEKAEKDFVLQRLECTTVGENGEQQLLSVGTGEMGIYFSSADMTQDRLNSIFNRYVSSSSDKPVKNFTFRAGRIDVMGDPRVDPGDIIRISEPTNGISGTRAIYYIPVMALSFDYDGGLFMTLEAFGVSDSNEIADIRGPAAKEMERISAEILQATYVISRKIDADMVEASYAKIDLSNIAAGTITTAMIDTGAIGTAQIADGSITDAKIVDLSASKLTAGIINAGVITVTNLNADNITAGTINGQRIADDAITNSKVADGAISRNKLVVGELQDLCDVSEYDPDSINPTQSETNLWTIDSGYLVANAASIHYLSGRKKGRFELGDTFYYAFEGIAGNENGVIVSGVDYTVRIRLMFYENDGTLLTSKFSEDIILTNELTVFNGTIKLQTVPTKAVMYSFAIQAKTSAEPYPQFRIKKAHIYRQSGVTMISDGAITTDKIVASAITTAKIASEAITSNKIVSNAILSGHIKAGEVKTVNLDAGAVTAAKIDAGAVTAEKIDAGAITTEKLDTKAIKSINYSGSTNASTEESYSTEGTFFDLSTGMLRSKNFCITSNGNAFFKGSIAVGTNVGGFSVNSNFLEATMQSSNKLRQKKVTIYPTFYEGQFVPGGANNALYYSLYQRNSISENFTQKAVFYIDENADVVCPRVKNAPLREELYLASDGNIIVEIPSSYRFAPDNDGGVRLGYTTARWYAVYATNGVITTSDEREKDIIGSLSEYKDIFMDLKPVAFRWKSGIDDYIHFGVGAQTAEKAISQRGVDDLAMIQCNEGRYGAIYTELLMLSIPVVQDHESRIVELEREVRLLMEVKADD